MDVKETNDSERLDSFMICSADSAEQLRRRRWTELPSSNPVKCTSGSPSLQYNFLSFSHFLNSLPKIPSAQRTSMWILKCDFSSGCGDLAVLSWPSPCPLDEDGSLHQEEDEDDELHDCELTQNDTLSLIRSVETSHSLSVVRRKDSPIPRQLELEIFKGNDAVSECKAFENKHDTAQLNSSSSDCLHTAYIFSTQDETSESISRGKRPAGSSICFSEPRLASVEFFCFWNTCTHKEKTTDHLFHHVLHSHLHRSTDFRSTRCLWRGCSRDGILKVFNSRHKLLVHVGIHCQKLKEPHMLNESTDQAQCTPPIEEKNASLTNSMQNLIGLRRLFTFRKTGQSPRQTKP